MDRCDFVVDLISRPGVGFGFWEGVWQQEWSQWGVQAGDKKGLISWDGSGGTGCVQG